MSYKTLQLREKILIFGLILSMVGAAYAVFRWAPNAKQVQILEEQKGFVDTQRQSTKLPRVSSTSSAYATTLSKGKDTHKTLIEALSRAQAQYVAVEDDAELQKLRREISNLARNSGLTVLETHTLRGEKAEKVFQSLLGLSQRRPLQVLTLQTRYAALSKFLRNLNYLSWKVQVVSLNLRVANTESLGRIQPLDVKIMLSM